MPDNYTDTAPTDYGRLGVAMCHALSQAGGLNYQCTQGEAQRPLEQFLTSLRIGGFEISLQPILPVNTASEAPRPSRAMLSAEQRNSRRPVIVEPNEGDLKVADNAAWFINVLADVLKHENMEPVDHPTHLTTAADAIIDLLGERGVALVRVKPIEIGDEVDVRSANGWRGNANGSNSIEVEVSGDSESPGMADVTMTINGEVVRFPRVKAAEGARLLDALRGRSFRPSRFSPRGFA